MNVRPPHKTVVPNSSIELFFLHSGRLVIVLTQDGTTANSKTRKLVQASRDAYMNLIPTDQVLTSRKTLGGVGLYLCGIFLFPEHCLRIQVAQATIVSPLFDAIWISNPPAKHLIPPTDTDQFASTL
jgi:hypothetical protein